MDRPASGSNFIRQIVEADLASGKHKRIVTRFPPEPNGYLHFGHAKSICLNFGLAGQHGGVCHLRFDDTNPVKEEQEYVDAIKDAAKWLGFEWGEHEYYASDYFDRLYQFAEALIKRGHAYVDSQSADEIRATRGTLVSHGILSPYRSRSAEENLELFRKMKSAAFPDGAHVLRAKIDMASPNINLRDPVMYRIRHAHHHRTGDKWCIYPTYDWAHGLSDCIERVSHSLCTLELEDYMREHLNDVAPRRMAVLDPVKLVIENYPLGTEELVEVPNHPQKPDWGKRRVPFSRELWIERDDYQEKPEKGYFRLFPGNEVRLRYGYVIACKRFDGSANTVYATYYPDSRSGTPGADKYKVKGNIHWVSATHAFAAEVRLYDRLFRRPQPEGAVDLNPASKTIVMAQLEPALRGAKPEERFQFERHGYFVADRVDSRPGAPRFNRAVTLRDSWSK